MNLHPLPCIPLLYSLITILHTSHSNNAQKTNKHMLLSSTLYLLTSLPHRSYIHTLPPVYLWGRDPFYPRIILTTLIRRWCHICMSYPSICTTHFSLSLQPYMNHTFVYLWPLPCTLSLLLSVLSPYYISPLSPIFSSSCVVAHSLLLNTHTVYIHILYTHTCVTLVYHPFTRYYRYLHLPDIVYCLICSTALTSRPITINHYSSSETKSKLLYLHVITCLWLKLT